MGLGLMLVQAATGAASGPPAKVDLSTRRPCVSERPDDIVVCGRDDQPYRLAPLPEKYVSPLIPKASISILGGEGAVEAEQGDVGGIPSKRLMTRMKWRF